MFGNKKSADEYVTKTNEHSNVTTFVHALVSCMRFPMKSCINGKNSDSYDYL